MYKTIIVPIDLGHTEKGKAMIDAAGKLVDKGGRIVLVNVVEEMPGYILAELPEGLLKKSSEAAKTTLQDLASAAGLDAEIEVRIGRPATTINSVAADKEADLIMIASHKPGLQDYLLGSTAAGVVRHAKCSVLIDR